MPEDIKNPEEEEKDKKKILIMILLLLLIFILTFGISYAYFSIKSSGGPQSVTTRKLSLTFGDGTPIVRNENIAPIPRTQIFSKATKKSFTVTNKSNGPIYTLISIENMTLPDELNNVDFSWALYKGDTKVSMGNFNIGKAKEIYLTQLEEMGKDETVSYDLYIWIEESGTAQNTMQDKLFIGTITANGVGELAYKKLSDHIKSSVLNGNPTFSKDSNDKGLYKTNKNTLSNKTTYYYKGEVNNNYLSFAGQLFRIVRINEDDSIRIVTQNNITNSIKYSESYNSNYSGSNLEKIINSWYTRTIGENANLNSKVIDGTFCNDTSDNYSGADKRFTNDINPVFSCYGETITTKAATLSADEIIYSGAIPQNQAKTYLNNNQNFWTMTPKDQFNLFTWGKDYSYLIQSSVNNGGYAGTRAVINLSPDVVITMGNGTANDPYVIN